MVNLRIVKKDKLCLNDLLYGSSDGNCISGDMNGFYFRKDHFSSFTVMSTGRKVTSMAMFLEGVYVIGFDNGSVYLFNVNDRMYNPTYTGSFLFVMDSRLGSVLKIETFSNYILTVHSNTVTIYNSLSNKMYNLYDHPVEISAITMYKGDDLPYVITGDVAGTIRIVGFNEGSPVRGVWEFCLHLGKIQRILMVGEYFYILSKNGVISKHFNTTRRAVNWRYLQGEVSDFVLYENYVIAVGSESIKRFIIDKNIKSIHKVMSKNNQIFICGSDGVFYTLNMEEDNASHKTGEGYLSEYSIVREPHKDVALVLERDPRIADNEKTRATERRYTKHDDIDEMVDEYVKANKGAEEKRYHLKIYFQKLFGIYYRRMKT